MAYYGNLTEQELGFDAFIAPDDFNRTAQPVDIYEVFKREYALNGQARYIYYYSDGDYPLTLTPTANEYYKYGYTQGEVEVMGVDVPLNGTAVTIFNETVTTKRWVIVYRPSMAKFELVLTAATMRALWLYCGDKINGINKSPAGTYYLKYIHFANLNTITSSFPQVFGIKLSNQFYSLAGRVHIPETVTALSEGCFLATLISKINLPITRPVGIFMGGNGDQQNFNWGNIIEYNAGATIIEPSLYIYYLNNLQIISVSTQNTFSSSFNLCDIIYSKGNTSIQFIAPKTVRGLYLPDQLPQSQIDLLGTKLQANIMQNHQLYIGTQITDLTNLYLANKSFVTIEVGAGNTAFSVDENILYNATKTQLIKAGTYNTGNLIIPNGVTEILANSFLRCSGYTGNLTIPSSITNIENLSISALTQLTSLTLPLNYDTAIYRDFRFANFSAESLNASILNLMDGAVGSPKFFIISKTSLDALNAAYPNAVSNASLRFIVVTSQLPTQAPIDYLMLMEGTPMDTSFFNTTTGTPTYNTGGDYLGIPMECVTGANFETLSRVDLSNTNKISLSFWLKVNAGVKTTIMVTDTVSSHRLSATMPNGFWIDSSLTIQDWGTDATPLNILQTSGAINNGVWRHFVITKDRALNHPNEWKLYINGVSTTFNYPVPHTVDYSTNFKNWLFQIYSSNCFISRFKVYGRILNQTEVTQLYNDIFL